MTTRDERYRALLLAEQFLTELTYPAVTPRVPKAIREQARRILRHYPSRYDLLVKRESKK